MVLVGRGCHCFSLFGFSGGLRFRVDFHLGREFSCLLFAPGIGIDVGVQSFSHIDFQTGFVSDFIARCSKSFIKSRFVKTFTNR